MKILFLKKLIVETLGHPDNKQDANDNFQQLQQSLKAVAKKVIPPKPGRKHKPWVDIEILELMEKRRKVKANRIEHYKIDKEIRK